MKLALVGDGTSEDFLFLSGSCFSMLFLAGCVEAAAGEGDGDELADFD